MSRTDLLVEAKWHYEWFTEHTPTFLQQNELDGNTFADQIALCREMLELLPAKIDRIHYGRESAFEFL